MFNNKKIEALEKEIRYLQDIFGRQLNELWKMQQRILNHLKVELKTTPEKKELIGKEILTRTVCVPEEDLKAEEVELDKLENCKVCPKCGGKRITSMYILEKNHLEKFCECGFYWIEDCLDKKSGK